MVRCGVRAPGFLTRLGNIVDPHEIIDAHGADALRWYYLASQQPWAGYRFSADTVGESVRQFLLTLWNTYSFFVLYANAADEQADATADWSTFTTLATWMIGNVKLREYWMKAWTSPSEIDPLATLRPPRTAMTT